MKRRRPHQAQQQPSPRPRKIPCPKVSPTVFSDIGHPEKRAFLAAFAMLGHITDAAEEVGISRVSHWYWLQKDEAYKQAFAVAQRMAADLLESAVYKRARDGWDVGVWHQGQRVGTERKYSDTLAIAYLNANLPEKYKYRADVTHDLSPAMQALLAHWTALRDQASQGADIIDSPALSSEEMPEAWQDAMEEASGGAADEAWDVDGEQSDWNGKEDVG